MADQDALFKFSNEATGLGNNISVKMVEFLDHVKDQPAGFRDLGLDFLAICQILNSLQGSLNEHFKSNQSFPPKAIPELMKVLTKTLDDFARLQSLLHKFMEYEKGGTFAMLQKTWRLVFADKDIAKIRSSLQVNKGALTMTMLLTNITSIPSSGPPAYEYGMLAAKLEHQGSVAGATSVASSQNRLELPGGTSSRPELASTSTSPVSDTVLTPSISEMSISGKTLDPSIIYTTKAHEKELLPAVNEVIASVNSVKSSAAPKEQANETPSARVPPLRTLVDRSKLQKRIPKHPLGTNPAALQKTLINAVLAHKHNLVEQLLDRGASPDTGPETHIVMETIYLRDVESLKLLLSFGADPNAKAADGNTPLCCACQRNIEEEAKILLEYGADPNISAPDWTPLPWALDHNAEGMVHLLLQYGADPNLVMQNGYAGLVYACEKNCSPSILQDFFNYGTNPNAKDGDGNTALGVACSRNYPELVKVLLSNGADPNLPGGELPVITAMPHPACLKLLLAAGADLRTCQGAMELAISQNLIDVVKLLLDAGFSPNEKQDQTNSPLTTAICENRPEILKLLLSRGANPNLEGEEMPLIMAVNSPELLGQLITGGADVKLCKGLIEQAVYHDSVDSIPTLLEAGVPIDEKNADDCTGVTTAIRDNHIECLSFLFSHGADPDEPGEGLPIALAARFEDPERLRIVLAAGADVNKQHDGRTALMEACNYNAVESVKLLLERGADLNVADEDGNAAMDIAVTNGHDDIVILLLDRMA